MGPQDSSLATSVDLAPRKLRLIEALTHITAPEDLRALEQAFDQVHENARARQLVIGYRPSGLPVLKQRFLDRLRHTLSDIEHDEFTSLAAFEAKAADW